MRFGEYIQKLREAKAYSLTFAARELGMTPQRLCDIEQGRRNYKRHPPLDLLRKMATVYDHPYSNLITNTEFFTYEKVIISDMISDLEPVANALEKKVLEMVVEAKSYTPEMEVLSGEALHLSQELKMGLMLAKARHSRISRIAVPGSEVPTKKRKAG